MIGRPLRIVAVMIAASLVVVAGVVTYEIHARRAKQWSQSAPAASQPSAAEPATKSTGPTATQAGAQAAPTSVLTYMDVVRAEYPVLAKTPSPAVPLELSQSARIILHDPVCLGQERGDLWITRPDAPPTDRVLRDAINPDAADPQSHVLRDRPVFIHWTQSDSGDWLPHLICREDDGRFSLVGLDGRRPLPARRDFRWDRAFAWNDSIVVPSGLGVSVIQLTPRLTESYHALINAPTSSDSGPQVLPDWQGLLAWAPTDKGHGGSDGAARFLDGKWTDLTPALGWPRGIRYLVPLRDGTVFQFVDDGHGDVTVRTAALDSPPVDETALRRLVVGLDDADPDIRRKAFTELADFGPGAWPFLQRLESDARPQARVLIGRLLKDRNRPTLSGMTLPGRRLLKPVCRLSDGGEVFYADQGISTADDPSNVVAPAWLSMRPGHSIELLPATLTNDLKPETARLDAIGDEWFTIDEVRGPCLFFGNGLATLLRKDERQFTEIVGTDRLGRRLFREPGTDRTLIIDPHLPDPTPRLPVWELAVAESVGRDARGWPVIRNGAAYALTETDWEPLPADKKPVKESGNSETRSTGDAPILIAEDGTRWYGGDVELREVRADGRTIVWPLPPQAQGVRPAWLIRARNGKLFLFNRPGRVLRIAETPNAAEPFTIEATFTHDIPYAPKLTRVWLDPAGRIDMIWGNRLAILFPDGYIPRPILEKMVGRSGLDADEP